MPDPWIFGWYAPGNVPQSNSYWLFRGATTPPPPPIPFLLSDNANGLSVRFRSLLGAYGPPYVPVNQDIPFIPGSHHKFTNVEETEVDLRLLVQADSRELLWAKLKPLPNLFNPLNGPGVLQVTTPIGTTRNLNCRCISGFKVDPSTLQDKSVEVSLSFYANDPYWYSSTWETVEVNIVVSNVNTLLPDGKPMFPFRTFRLSIPGGLQEFVVRNILTNLGDVNTYPYIYVTGPYSQPILTNFYRYPFEPVYPILANPAGTPKDVLNMTANNGVYTAPKNAGGWVAADCKEKTLVQGSNLVNVIAGLTTSSRFWPLTPGDNNVQCGILLPGTGQEQKDERDAKQPTVVYTWQHAYSTIM